LRHGAGCISGNRREQKENVPNPPFPNALERLPTTIHYPQSIPLPHTDGVAREYVLQPFHPNRDLRINYAEELNAQQLAAVQASPGPNLVLAGAGAGKTRTLTYRVAWLIEHGVAPDRILLLTFTNKAAREMMSRVADLLGGDVQVLWGGTFHSIGSRLLRRHADRLGYRQDFTIADREDSKELLATAITDVGIDVIATRFPKPEVLGDIFSMAVNTGRSLEQLIGDEHGSFESLLSEITRVQKRYAERKRLAGVMDFDDLLVLWLKLLQEHEDVRDLVQRRFQHLLVDEYQDTNTLQGALIDTLAGRHGNIMAVGDDAQSIYSWRGANFANILEFSKRYPTAQVFKIETNYRSTPQILALANAAIALNTQQYPKILQAARKPGDLPVVVVCGDATEQAIFIAQRVLELREEGRALEDICVLYRSHFHALELQLELTRRNIPFKITSGIRFFEQAHIKDVVSFLKFVVQPRDELAFKRLVKMLPGIGGKGADKLWTALESELQKWPLLDPQSSLPPSTSGNVSEGSEVESTVIPPHSAPPPGAETRLEIAPLLMRVQGKVPKRAATAWAQFAATVSQLEDPAVRHTPATMIRLVMDAGYEEYLEANFERPRNRLEDLQQLAAYAQQFPNTPEFLSELALQTNLEAEAQADSSNDDDERIRLSTIHQAKGLEFGAVFVIMLCDGLFPSERSLESSSGEEEERRLFYVAVTRAKDLLYLSYPLIRSLGYSAGSARALPSRFLGEIPRHLTEEWNLRPYYSAPPRPDDGYPSGNSSEEEPF